MKRQAKLATATEDKPTKKTLVQTKLVPDVGHFSHEPEKPGTFSNPLHISHWNVNSLAACREKDGFKHYFRDNNFDVICFNETKLSFERFRKLDMQSHDTWFNKYFQYWNFSTRKLGYSGVAVFSKERPLSVVYDIGAKELDQEGRAITLEFSDFFLVYAYVPNSGGELERLGIRTDVWDTVMTAHLEKLREKKGVVYLGDLNVAPERMDLANPDVNTRSAGFTIEERQKFQELKAKGFKDCFRELYPTTVKYTWWSQRAKTARANNIGWRIDHCIVDEKTLGKVKDVIIRGDVHGSDHCPVEVLLDLTGK